MDTGMIKRGFFFGIIAAAFLLGYMAFQNAMPGYKEKRIYNEIKIYSPYKLEKRMGGLEIIDKRSGTKEKPSSQEVLLRLDELDVAWGKEHLKIEGNDVLVLGENGGVLARIYLENEKERKWVESFYQLK